MGEVTDFAYRQLTRRIVQTWWAELRDAACANVDEGAVVDMFATADLKQLEKVYARDSREVTDLLLEDIVPRAFSAGWIAEEARLSKEKIALHLNEKAAMMQAESAEFLTTVNAKLGIVKKADINDYMKAFNGESKVNFKLDEQKRLFGYLVIYMLLKQVKRTKRYNWKEFCRALKQRSKKAA